MDPDFETMKVVLLLFISGSVAFAQECPTVVPPKCDEFSMPCYGGADMNGCPYGDFCAPSKGKVMSFSELFWRFPWTNELSNSFY